MRLLVVALNPSIDAEWRVTRVRPEEKNEILSERRWPGGKGVNVARWLRHLGQPAKLLLPLGGATGREMAGQLRRLHLPHQSIPLRTPTRVNIIVTPRHGRQMRFNPVWARLTAAEWRRVREAVDAALGTCDCLVLSGSLPRGAPVTAYRTIIRAARRRGVRCVLDCEGPALQAAVAARPDLLKPNEDELAAWCGRPLTSTRAVLAAALELSARSGGWVLVSRGRGGALLVSASAQRAFAASVPAVRVRNTVGAGDALLAAAVAQMAAGAPPPEWLRAGAATGTAAVCQPAGHLPAPPQLARVARRVRVADLPPGEFVARQHR